ncbi:MAG: TatD family hydrolase [Candidatus Omnitrophica bacterium]|nr:TatD family hydrolase [Candidatus Omnitrophota bacterium]
MLIDTHCHINSLNDEERKAFDEKALPSEYRFIDVSIDIESSKKSLDIVQKNPHLYSAIGFHPFSIESFAEDTISRYEEIIGNNDKIVAVGEIGLDFTAKFSTHDQVRILKQFIALAQKFSKPIIVHNRFNVPMIFSVLDEYYEDYEKIVFHCFSQDEIFLKRVVNKRGYASFSLNVLRKKREILNSLRMIPLDRLLLETDSPYMQIRNERSSPLDIDKVYAFAADIKQIDIGQLAEKVSENVRNVFGIE